MHFTSLTALVTCSLLPTAFGATWHLSQTWIGTDILSAFEHEAIADPTHGRVNYVGQATALSQNLTYAHGDTYVLRADHTTVLDPNGAGRNSVRIKSTATFDHHVAVFDVQHMPEGCGTWPAIWETNEATWPNDGEIDLVEGVNNQGTNLVSLHTSAGCTVPASRAETGTPNSLDCVAADNGNTGCNVQAADAKSFGPSFNAVGGGWYAVERSSTAIKAWFWPRDGGKPSDIGSGTINTDNWGTPVALFPNTSCDIDSHFGENNIIINLTFCGDWAGSVYGNSGCPSTCVDYVNDNPGAFTNAYFEINSIRVYE